MKAQRRYRGVWRREVRAEDAPVYLKPPEGVATETIPPIHTGEAAAVNDEAKDQVKEQSKDQVKQAGWLKMSRVAGLLKVAWLAAKVVKEVAGLFWSRPTAPITGPGPSDRLDRPSRPGRGERHRLLPFARIAGNLFESANAGANLFVMDMGLMVGAVKINTMDGNYAKIGDEPL